MVKWKYCGQPVPMGCCLETAGWDHEHCDGCERAIRVDDTAWLTVREPWVKLCRYCFAASGRSAGSNERLQRRKTRITRKITIKKRIKSTIKIRSKISHKVDKSNDDRQQAEAAACQGKKLGRSFYRRPSLKLARDLIGTILVRRLRGKEYRARIVETEAYLGPVDLASHASKGRTRRTEVLFGPAGHAYVYFIYGMYEMFNIVAGKTGDAQAVLVRAAEPLDGWMADLSGPGKLARGFRITRSENGLDLTGDKLFLLGDPSYRPRILRTKRVGVEYAKQWKEALLRFLDANSPAVSRPNPATPRRRRPR